MQEKLKKISLKQQIYLETIYDLSRSHGHAHVKGIAERLNNRMPSVTEAMRKLAAMGLVNYDVRKNISLTEKGMSIATELDKRHSVLADFYGEILGCNHAKAEEIACKVEHVVDAAFCDRLAGFADFLRHKKNSGMDLVEEFRNYYQQQDNKKCD
jgi:DtxR family Mn-dependent transcriptional regulator